MKSFFSLLIVLTVFVPAFLFAQNSTDTAAKNNNIANDTTVFEKVDIEASFPAGDLAWQQYVYKTLANFNPADNGAPTGFYTVRVQFVVDIEGNISNVKALTHFGFQMEKKAIDLIKKSPKWNPAILNGKPVKAYRKLPVTFGVQAE